MRSDFQFSNLLGTVYRQGNLLFTADGSTLLSPVGNRVSVFDLIRNTSYTLNYEHRKNIACIALNKQGNLLISVDEDGRAILVNFRARTVLHHFNFKDKVRDIKFSPDGKNFAIAVGRFIQVWKTPDVTEDRQFAPFVRHRVYAGHYSEITSISWSRDSRFILSTSKDLTARLFSLHSSEKDVKMTFAGHRDHVMGAFFNKTQEHIYTISKDGALFRWEYKEREEEEDLPEEEKHMSWRIAAKNFFYADANVKSAAFHPESNLLVVGFGNGEFRLYELPDFTMIQQLSMGTNAVNTVSINETGEWIAFGSKKLGQLLVYEWQSESYILRQQGHFDSMNSVVYSPDGSRLVTAADDGKIKIWDVTSGFCLATFEEHTSAVTDLAFARHGQVLFSSSLDGTVRAWDLMRYRNFRTFTSTERIQFSSVAVDSSGEVVAAGSLDDFAIHVWSVRTGQLLDQLAGHEGPVSCLSFGTEGKALLASSSWDKTIRIWDIFSRTQTSEPLDTTTEVLSLAMRPDSKEVAASTLDGKIVFWDVETGKQLREIDGKKDILQGRYTEDPFTSQHSARGKCFSTIAYSFDGLTLVAAGNNNSICLYDLPNEVLLRRFTVSLNMQLNGTQQFLNSKRMAEGGALDLIDDDGELSDVDERTRADNVLPGSKRGDISERSSRPEIRVASIIFSPTASAFAVASTEGLLIYSVDDTQVFDPYDLDVDVTPENTIACLNDQQYLDSIVMAFRLNETYLIQKVYEGVPAKDIALVSRDLPVVYLPRLIEFIGSIAMESQHIEFNLLWISSLFTSHGKYISKNKHLFSSGSRAIQRFLNRVAKDVVGASTKNGYLHDYLMISRPKEEHTEKVGKNHDTLLLGEDEEEEEEEEEGDAADGNMDVDPAPSKNDAKKFKDSFAVQEDED
ncbi:U3 snoRNP protein [Brettanomyces bruxellensis]|uniref:U3 snoRNP protein n=1 Tax=Dekkera bruxellensis TaxID=5007 RepID=A0A871RCU7_DEKBR|nr:U3 snoRNP protein [Brettanomyces bruxellensis]QOU19940.1 U3 snoRNP protein [Brettanomyces bruxellensis]